VNNNPVVLIIGTATQGASESFYQVDRVSDAARTFGKTGTLVRGMYEASIAERKSSSFPYWCYFCSISYSRFDYYYRF